MNCQLCQNQLETCLDGQLAEDIRIQVEEHAKACPSCAESYHYTRIAARVIAEEKSRSFNPWLSTRVVAQIKKIESSRNSAEHVPVFSRLIRPVLATVSVAAAILAGVMIGSLYKPHDNTVNELPVELGYINDADLESFYLFSED